MDVPENVVAFCSKSAKAIARSEEESALSSFGYLVKQCESPIEQLFAVAFKTVVSVNYGMPENPHDDDCPGVHLRTQVQIGPYRVDFLIWLHDENGKRVNWIIECDGHDFHEKTKEQAASDKKRDRYLTKMGYRVLRFTGAEIFANPYAVAEEVFEIVFGVVFVSPRDLLESAT